MVCLFLILTIYPEGKDYHLHFTGGKTEITKATLCPIISLPQALGSCQDSGPVGWYSQPRPTKQQRPQQDFQRMLGTGRKHRVAAYLEVPAITNKGPV